MYTTERRKPMIPPSKEVPPAVVQVVVEFKTLMQDIRAFYNLDRRGKGTQHESRESV